MRCWEIGEPGLSPGRAFEVEKYVAVQDTTRHMQFIELRLVQGDEGNQERQF